MIGEGSNGDTHNTKHVVNAETTKDLAAKTLSSKELAIFLDEILVSENCCYASATRLDARTWATMGVGLGYCIAAAVANPDRLVVAVEGNFGFGFNAMEVEPTKPAQRIAQNMAQFVEPNSSYESYQHPDKTHRRPLAFQGSYCLTHLELNRSHITHVGDSNHRGEVAHTSERTSNPRTSSGTAHGAYQSAPDEYKWSNLELTQVCTLRPYPHSTSLFTYFPHHR